MFVKDDLGIFLIVQQGREILNHEGGLSPARKQKATKAMRQKKIQRPLASKDRK